jgi:HSP20 family protein
MTIVRRASPLGELLSLRQAMDRLFEDSFVRPSTWSATGGEAYGLPLDVFSDADELVVEAALPGFKPDDVDITIEDGTLSIHAESHGDVKTGEGEAFVREIRRGSVARVVALPTGLESDKATATFEHGMLTLRIPRAEAVKPRQIRITPMTPHDQISTGSTVPAAGETSTGDEPAGA